MRAVSVILGGGQGTRLMPLTTERSKPAVPIAGKYRLVDIPISNCINSGIRQIFLLTQYNSESLHRHIARTYRFDAFSHGYVRILAAQQTPAGEKWFQGTADAVRQNLGYLLEDEPDFVVILSGDQLYRMNFAEVIKQHVDRGADVTICTKPVDRRDAGSLGIMHVDDHQRIVKFVEKPGNTDVLTGLRAPMFKEERFLASMGIYVFNSAVLRKLLAGGQSDFGKHIIPESIASTKVVSYIFDGYWRDIGTLRSFWETNLALTDPVPEFNFYDPRAPIYTDMRHLPPSKINRCDLNRCLIGEGSILSGHRILHSVIGIRARVGDGTVIEHSYVMGADYFERDVPTNSPAMGIGKDCYIKNAIVDKNARIGDDVYISPEGKPENMESELFVIRDGIIAIPKNTVIPSGTRL